jgi:hypothetical protein
MKNNTQIDTFGSYLSYIRRNRIPYISTRQLCQELHVNVNMFNKCLQGYTMPPDDIYNSICSYLRVTELEKGELDRLREAWKKPEVTEQEVFKHIPRPVSLNMWQIRSLTRLAQRIKKSLQLEEDWNSGGANRKYSGK